VRGFAVAVESLRDRRILAAEASFACYSVVEHGTWLALLLYAFDRGGVGEVGVVALALLIPAVVAAPVGSALIERMRPNRALAAGFGTQAAGCVLTAIALAADGPAIAVYGLAAMFTAAMSLSRPTMSAVLPVIANSPARLSGANSIAGFIENIGVLVGPAVAGVLVASSSTATVFWIATGLLAAAAGLALTIGHRPMPASAVAPDMPTEADPADGPESLTTRLLAGFSVLRAEPEPRLLVGLIAATWFVFGALEVAMVAVAVDKLGRDEATAGLLAGSVGLGGLVGGVLAIGLAGRRRQSLPVVVGLIGVGLPVAMLAGVGSLPAAAALLVVVGMSDVVADVAGRTLIQGLAPEDTLARVFGAMEGLATAAVGLGGVTFSIVAVGAGIDVALVGVGVTLPILALAGVAPLLGIDRERPEVDADLLALVKTVPVFAPLPAFRLEQMIVNLEQVAFAADQPVFTKGDRGDRLYLVAAGTAEVELAHRVATHTVGGFFGEMALLFDQPRMATVRAGPDGLSAYTLDRSVFLRALGDHPRSSRRMTAIVKRRLDDS
jgi:MFS family permease